MAGNSESYTIKVERRAAALECDRRELARMKERGIQRSEQPGVLGLSIAELEAKIRFDEGALKIARSY